MRSEALDITIESRGESTWVLFSGLFNAEQIPSIKEKLLDLINDGNKNIVIHLEEVSFIDKNAARMFLNILNIIMGKRGDLKFIFKNTSVSEAFTGYKNIFSIFPDEVSLNSKKWLNNIKRQGLLMSRKTGIRLSKPVAFFLLFVLSGWFISLGFIIHLQNRVIQKQETKIHQLSQWKHETETKVKILEEKLRPLNQLGLVSGESDD